jgi:hypothetical protein
MEITLIGKWILEMNIGGKCWEFAAKGTAQYLLYLG